MNILQLRSELRSGRTIFDLPLRVTFYARVSTDKDEQLNSLENQVQYYTELIQSQPSWTFIPGYIDEGLSGTTTKRRDSFLRMIRDAKAGRFDFIITKEISRFSRSTLDSIQYTQELLDHGVGVLFQNDNINTLDTDSEFRLVVMAGVAQDEVRKLSERLKFGFRQAIKNGRVLGSDTLWGYDKKNCVLTVNEAEAQVVRRIFDLYANRQMGIRRISQTLLDEGFTSRQGNAFNVLTIRHILCNPKYKGWYCANKSQTVDYRSKRKIFLDESQWTMHPDPSIPAIVPEELWDRANALPQPLPLQRQNHLRGARRQLPPPSAEEQGGNQGGLAVPRLPGAGPGGLLRAPALHRRAGPNHGPHLPPSDLEQAGRHRRGYDHSPVRPRRARLFPRPSPHQGDPVRPPRQKRPPAGDEHRGRHLHGGIQTAQR